MKYIKLVIKVAEKYQENLIAELFEMGFEGFEQCDEQLITYIKKEDFSIIDREQIEILLGAYPGNGFVESEEVVAEQNWNQQWEETIKPQVVGKFFIKPTWSPQSVPEEKILLKIDPKMSFGTGYHETTRLMLRRLPHIISNGDTIIDAGTGTGILSIAAIKLGAKRAFAFDIDEWSISNTIENILLNEVSDSIHVEKGSGKVIPKDFLTDVVLANIERNTILELFERLDDVLKKEGVLLLSGLLEKDKPVILSRLEDHYQVNNISQDNEWIAIEAIKKRDESFH